LTELFALVEVRQRDFEQRGRRAVRARERNENAGIKPLLASSLELVANGFERALLLAGAMS
jgi:hypothetical protein